MRGSLERTTPSQERSSEEGGRLERPRFCEGFARAKVSSFEGTAPSQEGLSEVCGWLERFKFCEGFARANCSRNLQNLQSESPPSFTSQQF